MSESPEKPSEENPKSSPESSPWKEGDAPRPRREGHPGGPPRHNFPKEGGPFRGGGDRPWKKRPSGPGGDREQRPYQKGGDRPHWKDRGDREGSDRPPRRDFDKPRGDRPHWKDRPQGEGSDRPPRRDFNKDRGDRPHWKDRGDREGSDRPPRRDFDKPRGDRPHWKDRPQGEGSDRPPRRDFNKDRGDRPHWKDRGDREGSDRPPRRDFDKPRGDRPHWKDRPQGEGSDRPPRRDFNKDRGDRPHWKDRPQGEGSDRPPRRDFDKPRGDRPHWKDRPQGEGSDRPPRREFDRGGGGGGERPFRKSGPGGERPPRRDFEGRGDRPFRKKFDDRGERPPFAERKPRPERTKRLTELRPRDEELELPPHIDRRLRYRTQLASDLLSTWRHEMAPPDRVASQFFRDREFLGSQDRRMVADCYFQAIRYLRRYDEAIRTGLEDSADEFLHSVHRASGFPIYESPNDRVWARPGDPPHTPSYEDLWVDGMRCALAMEDLEPGAILARGLLEEYAELWPMPDHPRFTGEWAEGTVRRIVETSRRLREDFRPSGLARKHSFPDWLWALLGYGLPPKELDDLGATLNQPARTGLRVNTLKATVDEYAEALTEAGLEFERGRLMPNALLLADRVGRGRLPGYEDGVVEFQDESTQFVAELLAPAPGSTVIDACAGGGGKTLHLAAKMDGKGKLYVYEPRHFSRKNLHERARRAGIHGMIEDLDTDTSPDGREADLVLLDVPCTGTGTLRRSPGNKWRTLPEDISQKNALQLDLLKRWSLWVRPGGRLAYATCSLLHAENGERIETFLKSSDGKEFRRVPFERGETVTRQMLTPEGDLQLWPHHHGCDGFFLSVLERKPDTGSKDPVGESMEESENAEAEQ
ncbi:MAG: hypothetical protein RLY93_16390 [Sumerlaeia bacterium]